MMVLNLQFWNGDKAAAMGLARLIADIEPKYRDDVTFLFSARYDTKHDDETVAYVAKKFPVRKFTCTRVVNGWPLAPNQMAGESYQHCVELNRSGRLKINVVMFLESDSVPLHKDWINMVRAEWLNSGKMVSGAWLSVGDAGQTHINGNCLMHIDFWHVCREIFAPPERGGWDASLASYILPHGHPSELIWSDYQLGYSHNPWRGDDFLWAPKSYKCPLNPLYGKILKPVWFHGIKTPSGQIAARKRLVEAESS